MLSPQVLLQASLHLTRGVLSWILNDDAQLLKELWWAAAWIRDAGLFCASAELCRRLFPEGPTRLPLKPSHVFRLRFRLLTP